MAHWFEDEAVALGYANARPAIHGPILELALRCLPSEFPRRVAVDVGCGGGGSTAPLRRVAEVVVGVDRSTAMLAAVRATGVAATFCAGRAEVLPFRDASIDLIVAAGSLDFVDLGGALREVSRVLVPGGNLLVYDFGAARRFRGSDDLTQWYSSFLGRWPPAVDARRPVTREALAAHDDVLRLRSREVFAIDYLLSPAAYTDYLMTQTNIASAVRNGASYDDIRSRCLRSLGEFFVEPRPVVFDGYIAHLSR